VVDRRSLGGWLGGPGSAYGGAGAADAGAVDPARATFGRRLAAVALDWAACLLIARAFTGSSWGALAVFAVENLLLLPTLGATFGMRLLGIGVVRLDSGRPLTVPAAAVRTVLLCLAVPALVWDRQYRGLHDKAVGSAVVRRPREGPPVGS
jgi:uncharacterized RDD family membrane protein YckC